MFKDVINVKKRKDVRYGQTRISFHQSYGEILALLDKHGCDKIATMKDGEVQKIAFVLDKNPYMIMIPRVYVDGVLDAKIGVRIVKYYLEALLELTKQRVLDFEFLMLGNRIIEKDGKRMTMKEAVDLLPRPELLLME